MKQTILTFFLIFFIATVNAQQFFSAPQLNTANFSKAIKKKAPNNKAVGDTLWYEDFDGGLPGGWNVVNNNAGINNFIWLWDTVAKNGPNSVGVPAIHSTTSSNGFMSLPASFYNRTTPTPVIQGMDTYFESSTISIPPLTSVKIKYQQLLIYCCRGAVLSTGPYDVNLFLQVSTDGFATYTNFLANGNIPSNAYLNNGDVNEIDISSAIWGASQFKIRFYARGMTDYVWYIDDIAVVEGGGQEIVDYGLEAVGRDQDPFPSIFPLNYIQNIGFDAIVKNPRADTIRNLNLEVTVDHIGYPGGTPGAGQVYQRTQLGSNSGNLPPFGATDTIVITSPGFSPNRLGEYSVKYRSTSTVYPVGDSNTIKIILSDTIFARDLGVSHYATGPSGYVRNGMPGGSANGDRYGSFYHLDSIQQGIEFSSLSFYVSGDNRNVGSVIRPVIWEFDSTWVFREVASSTTNYTITASQLNTWQTFVLDTGIALNRGNNFGDFVVGWEQVSIAGGSSFSVGASNPESPFTTLFSSFISFGHSQPQQWGVTGDIPMIRLNVKQILPVGLTNVNKPENKLSVYPNPSDGFFKVQMDDGISEFQLFDNRGRMIFQKQNMIPSKTERINLENEGSGLYFMKVIDPSGKPTFKKLIVK